LVWLVDLIRQNQDIQFRQLGLSDVYYDWICCSITLLIKRPASSMAGATRSLYYSAAPSYKLGIFFYYTELTRSSGDGVTHSERYGVTAFSSIEAEEPNGGNLGKGLRIQWVNNNKRVRARSTRLPDEDEMSFPFLEWKGWLLAFR